MPGGRFEYDVDNLLEKQKIVFIMPVSSYSEPYVEGYFIDTKGKKRSNILIITQMKILVLFVMVLKRKLMIILICFGILVLEDIVILKNLLYYFPF